MTERARANAWAVRATLVSASVLLSACSSVPAREATRPTSLASRCVASSMLARWTIARLAWQLIAVPVDQASLARARPEIAAGAGGVLLTGAPAPRLESDLRSLIGAAHGSPAPFVMTDEEGGAVQRLDPLVPSFPSARTMGSTLSAREIERMAFSVGTRMRRLGLTMDLAPVADVDARPGPSSTNADGTRSFSGDATIAARDAVAFADGLASAGVLPVVKHFPGLGGSSGNSDLARVATLPWSSLRTALVPFERAIAAHVPAVMVANATVPGLSDRPASISKAVIDELRSRLHFHGVILTDSLSAVSIESFGLSVPDAAVAALRAGADMILYNSTTSSLAADSEAIVHAIEDAVARATLSRRTLTDDVLLVMRAKHFQGCALPA